MRLAFCLGDAVVILCVIIVAVFIGILCWNQTNTQESSIAVIYKNGKKVEELSLYQDTEYRVENLYTNKIVVKDKKVAIVESDCPGADCVHSGWIGENGRSIICLPNRVEIRMEGTAEVDFIVK